MRWRELKILRDRVEIFRKTSASRQKKAFPGRKKVAALIEENASHTQQKKI
jgi:hypothetical protein